MSRIRPIFLLIALGLGAASFFLSTSVWADLMKIKGASWFGTEVEATILDAAKFREISWTPGVDDSHASRDHVRLKYEFEVDGQTYHYPYEDGFVEVDREQLHDTTIAVTYWNADPARNHPVGKDYKYGDEMTGFVFGLVIGLAALLMMVSWIKGLLRPPEPEQQRAE